MSETTTEEMDCGSAVVKRYPGVVFIQDEKVKRFWKEFPAVADFDTQVYYMGMHMKGKSVPVPHYAAGFFMDVNWLYETYMKRMDFQSINNIYWRLERDDEIIKHVHPTTNVHMSWGKKGNIFFALCDNSSKYRRDWWLKQRNNNLDIICETMRFTTVETAQAKAAFRWYILMPRVMDNVPDEFIVRG